MSAYLSDADYQAYLHKHANWNFWVNVLDLTFYNLAISFIYGATVLSLYASYLTDSAVLIGLIPAVQGVMFLLPQLLLARQTQALPRKKPLLARISILERLPYSIIALSIFLWPNAPRELAYVVLIVCLVVATGSGGLLGPGWKAMLAKVIPVQRRGAMFGLSTALGGVLGLAGAAASRYILARYAYPTSYAICFGLCFFFQLCSYTCLLLNREPAREPDVSALSARDYWRRLPGMLRGHPNFCRYLMGHALLTFGMMGTALYIVYARRTMGITDGMAGNLTMAALFGQALSTPIMGRLADKRGNKWLQERAGPISAAAILLVALAPSEIWLYPAFMLLNVAGHAMSIAGMGITMEFSSEDEIPTYTAMAGTILGVPTLLAPLVGGWLADAGGFGLLFGVALVFSVSGFIVIRLAVKEPRQATPALVSAASAIDGV
jgi:MFS family permease